jgi:subtilisin family serine protease
LELVNLTALMERTAGSPDVQIGLIDGPVVTDHPALASERFRQIGDPGAAACHASSGIACLHGTFVAGILCGRRGSPAPAISPACTLLIRPVFTDATTVTAPMPTATPVELAAAIVECIDAGARVINLSLALAHAPVKAERVLAEALDRAAQRGVLVVAAAGNEGSLGSSVITRHPWVIPVAACDRRGRPMNSSNFGSSIGIRGLTAPGEAITSLSTEGEPLTLGGTSVAVPFVTGTIALLWSEFPSAMAARVKLAVTRGSRRASVIPPLLDAQSAFGRLAA